MVFWVGARQAYPSHRLALNRLKTLFLKHELIAARCGVNVQSTMQMISSAWASSTQAWVEQIQRRPKPSTASDANNNQPKLPPPEIL